MRSSHLARAKCILFSLLLVAVTLMLFAPPAQESTAESAGDVAVSASDTWYLAEGSTDGGFETWVLVQNPGDSPVQINIDFMTEAGILHGPEVTMNPSSRSTFNVGTFVETYDVSTKVTASGNIICERAVYWIERMGGHCSVGVTQPQQTWYMAEGASAGDFETWVLVQNPGDTPVKIDIDFMTGSGMMQGPIRTIPPYTRRSFNVGDTVNSYEVSTKVAADGPVICERAVYWDDKTGGHCSIGVTQPQPTWYLAEGATDGSYETWVLVQNPEDVPVNIDMDFMTGSGIVQGPITTLLPNSRRTFNLGDYVTTYDVSTRIEAIGGNVICERAMYWDAHAVMWDPLDPSFYIDMIWDRAGGHGSIGVTQPKQVWYMAEGYTGGDFDTWVLVQNPGKGSVDITLSFQLPDGAAAPPFSMNLPPSSRKSIPLDELPGLSDTDVSTKVIDSSDVICERSMYWDTYNDFSNMGGFIFDLDRIGGHDSIGFTP